MIIYFKTEKSIIKMNDVLEVNGKYLVMATLDRTRQCVLGEYHSQERAQEILNSIEGMIWTKRKQEEQVLIIAIPKE